MDKDDKRDLIFRINEDASRYYHLQLLGEYGFKGMDYLKPYGLDIDTIEKFGIGFAADVSGIGLINYLKKNGYTEDEISYSGLVAKINTKLEERPDCDDVDMFINEIVLPIIDESGLTVGLYAQEIEEDGFDEFSVSRPYSNLRKALYGINYAVHSGEDYLIVCYGVMDTLLMHQAGFDMTVSFPGIEEAAFQAGNIKSFTEKIVLCVDPSEYEMEWVEDVVQILEEDGIRISYADISPYKNAAELIINAGAMEMKKRIQFAKRCFTRG